ncbi:MAG: glutamate formimidoyltransferase [Candidatus Electryoneaceae bacterium]|nr:glutamate formimidoyltransferase [Candidatus Electryoneaceae bacterium]
MNQIVECVPNFSEGRDHVVIDAITAEITKVNGANLLDVDPGNATNRTVVTIAGDPEAVLEAAFQAIKKAAELIDMSKHKGAHPRFGATDVCPFVPVAGMTMDDCIELAKRLGKRVGDELGIPIYLYEYAAQRPERQNLANCRLGEYEGLSSRPGNPQWTPDFGPDTFNARSGATAISARDFLIAWNIDLNTKSTPLATRIANRLRERGYGKMVNGRFIRDDEGKVVMIPGKFEGVKAVGWFIDEYDIAQVSINVTKYKQTPLHLIFDEAIQLGEQFGVRITGSELVGLLPLDAMIDAGRYYLQKQGVLTGVSEEELVHIAIQSLGLSEVSPFDPSEKIIEYRIRKPGVLTSMTVKGFVDEVASDSPAPGGGSVAALVGAISAALASMVANLTFGKKGYKKHNKAMEEVAVTAQQLKAKLVDLVDRDSASFDAVMDAMKLPKKSDEQKTLRQIAIDEATKGAASVPFETLSLMPDVLKLVKVVAEYGNTNLTPDAGVAGLSAGLAARGAAYNVRVNLQGLPDDDFSKKLREDTDRILNDVDEAVAEIRETIEGRLWE